MSVHRSDAMHNYSYLTFEVEMFQDVDPHISFSLEIRIIEAKIIERIMATNNMMKRTSPRKCRLLVSHGAKESGPR